MSLENNLNMHKTTKTTTVCNLKKIKGTTKYYSKRSR